MSGSWLSAVQPALPDHCVPQNDFLLRFSSAFHTCVPTPLAFASNTLGTLSIISWLSAQLPQIYRNYQIGSVSGLSIHFLVVWLLGDLGNFLGALLTHQATWQIAIGCYYVFVDMCLVAQYLYYEYLSHGNLVLRVWQKDKAHEGEGSGSGGNLGQHGFEGPGTGQPQSRPRIIFRAPTFVREDNEKASSSVSGTPNTNTIARVGPSSPMPSPSPRTMLFIACMIAMANASPLANPGSTGPAVTDMSPPTTLEDAGTILSWMSTLLYLSSRLPQLFKNYRRKSTAGLSSHLFIAAFCGNLFYSGALFANPCAWSDLGAYGGGGWVGKEGSDRVEWVTNALPFFLGAFGVLGLDASVGVQFLLYGEKEGKLVVVEERGENGSARQGKRRLRRVSGWLRGWVPSFSEGSASQYPAEAGVLERRPLLVQEDRTTTTANTGYGALQ